MSILSAKKFKEAYLKQYEVEVKLNNRIATNMSRFEREKLVKDYKTLGKRQNALKSKINKSEFEEILEDTLCHDYDTFKDGDFDEEYSF